MTAVAAANVITPSLPAPRLVSPDERARDLPAAHRPVAAVRLSGADLTAVAAGLRDAGFAVLDIAQHAVGPAPRVLVLELPPEESARRRLLEASAGGPGRILVGPRLEPDEAEGLRPGRDVLVRPPFHPLHVAAAALRIADASSDDLAAFADRAFADLTAD